MIQAKHTAPNDLLYSSHYWFKSGMNKVVADNLASIAKEAVEYMEAGDTILDIGANDGTLLSHVPKKYVRVGVEPATNLVESLRKHADIVLNEFWKGYDGTAKVITAIGMFYDTEDPVEFLSLAKKSLAKDGTFITEMMTAKQMVDENDVGNLCHEHLMFYTWKTIKILFEKAGLEIFSITHNPQSEDGKGYRILARHWKNEHVDFHEDEPDLGAFFKNIETIKNETLEYLEHNDVYIYGASTKANTILQYYGTNKIIGAIDKDPDKVGRYLLTGVPIVAESELRKATNLWCVPYPFIDFFREKESFGGRWVVTNPDFRIYDSDRGV
jgi:hypothetical protein